ncbi:MAG TPA: hypothetical protein VFL65_00810 [Jatrophihabitans sp.]|nr:hypothetical protein [Jatrophihabitans sp.]
MSTALGQIVANGHARATAAGAAYMAAHAAANGVEPTIARAAALPAEQVETALRVTGPVALKVAASAGMLPEQASRAALVQVMGSTSRLSLLGARETVKASAEATNGYRSWMRVSHGGCSYCEAHSGVVFTVGDTEGDAFFAFHDHCACTIEPVPEAAASGGPSTQASEPDAAQTLADALTAETLGKLSDAGLSKLLATLTDDAHIDAVLGELERRDEAARAAQKAEAARAAAKARRDAKRAADLAAKEAKFDELVAAGYDPEVAYADAFGKSVEKIRRQAAIDGLRADGFTGVNFERLSSAAYHAEVEKLVIAAENGTRGAFFNAEGAKVNARAALRAGERPISPAELWTRGESFARKYASPELLKWWDDHGGRLTLSDFRASLLGGKVKERTAAESWHQ